MQKMTERPPSMAALVLREMNYHKRRSVSLVADRFQCVPAVLGPKREEPETLTYLVGLLEDDTALTVTNDNPVNLGILQLLNADLASEGTIGLVENVLGSNADLGVGQAAGEGEVERRGRDDDLSVRVEVGRVEVVHDAGDALSNTVPVLEGQLMILARSSRIMEG